jgi:hypothetical protein
MTADDFTPEVIDKLLSVIDARAKGHEIAANAAYQRELAARRLDLVRTAKEVLTENRRMKNMDADDVTAADVVAFAKELADYVG